MAAFFASVPPAALAVSLVYRHAPAKLRSVIRHRSAGAFASLSAGEGGSEERRRQLVLYTKPGCCLCDGLKEKLYAALSLAGGPQSLLSVDLQLRDITENPEWERLYQYEIPVLAKVRPDGTEETLPRLSPRLSVELIQKKLHAAFQN